MEKFKKRFNLKSFRERHNLTQEQMAEKLKISKSHYVGVELGRFDPSYKVMDNFGKAFNDYENIWEIFKKGA